MVKRNITIRRKYLNNKSRKGWYYYIKRFKKRPAYYKIHPNVSINNYLMAYEGKVRIKKKGVISYGRETPASKYLRKIKRSKTIDDLISVGISKVTIPDLRKVGKSNVHKIYKNLLKGQVLDKGLLDIIALSENVKKFKNRIESNITLVSIDGKVSFQLRAFNKSILDIKDDLGGIINKKVFEKNLQEVMKKGYRLASIPKGFDLKNYEKNFITSGISSVKVELKFRKGVSKK